MAVGVTVNAAIVGNVANIVANLETDSAEYNVRVEEVRSYLQKHRLNYELESRCDDFHRYLWTAHSGSADEDAFLDELPCTLQGDIVEQTRAKHMRGCPFFDCFSNDVVKSLALCLQPKVYCAGDLVVHAGDYGQSMFFLAAGTVNCFSNEAILATLGPGSYFGETALFQDQPRTNSIMALSFCDCFELSKSDLVAELQRRGMDLADAEKWFEKTHSQNRQRNKNVQQNILEAQDGMSKLSRLIDTSSDTKSEPSAAVEISMPSSGFRFLGTWRPFFLPFSGSYENRTDRPFRRMRPGQLIILACLGTPSLLLTFACVPPNFHRSRGEGEHPADAQFSEAIEGTDFSRMGWLVCRCFRLFKACRGYSC